MCVDLPITFIIICVHTYYRQFYIESRYFLGQTYKIDKKKNKSVIIPFLDF